MTAGPQAALDDAGLRAVTRQLVAGVCVLTVRHGSAVHGGTVSTATIVAQRPLCLSVSLRRTSYLARLALESGQLACNVLSARQALVADWFANPDRPTGLRQFEMVPWDPDPRSGIPLLRGALATLTCRVTGRHAVGADDDVLLTEVTGGDCGTGRPLVGFGGELHDAELHDVVRRQGWRLTEATTPTLH